MDTDAFFNAICNFRYIEILFLILARRDPSKRQIKPVNTVALSLLEDLEDDSDSEYVCDEKDGGNFVYF